MQTRSICIGNVTIGGGAPIAIQSMTNTDTADIDATAGQIAALEDAGCEIVRVAAYDIPSARCIAALKTRTKLPIVADVHFDYKIAIAAIEAGADKVRINPGNIGSPERIRAVVHAAQAHHIPLRVGANSGSVHRSYTGRELADALVASALDNVRILEKEGFFDICISLKASDARVAIAANRAISLVCDYPLHLGVTEAGMYMQSAVKSAIGIGALLADGIGDTIRVSVTGDPVSEIAIAKDILNFSGARRFGPEIIACPTCGRTRIDLEKLAGQVAALAGHMDKPIKIAVMGCAVNGPGEARDADVGIAGGDGEGLLFAHGEVIKKVPEDRLLEELQALLETL